MTQLEFEQSLVIGLIAGVGAGILLLAYTEILNALSDWRHRRIQMKLLAGIINKGRKFILLDSLEQSEHFTQEQIRHSRYKLFLHKLNLSLEKDSNYLSFDDTAPIYDALRHVQGNNPYRFRSKVNEYDFVLKRLESIEWVKKRA